MKTKGARNKKGVARLVNHYGYIEVFQPEHPLAKRNGYVLEHRMIAWDGGLLTDASLEVHHKNSVKTDNRVENFQVMTKAEHTSLTHKGLKRKPWSKERREAKSRAMLGNKNAIGNIYENEELLQ
jgi:hypothetical protein